MTVSAIIRYITSHPLTKDRPLQAIARFIKWQVRSRLNQEKFFIYPFVGKSKLPARKGLTGITGNIYTGLHEFQEMSFVLHVLQAGDLFGDVGANAGSYTVLASAVKGAKTISFEPVPNTFAILKKSIHINDIGHLVTPHNVGLAGKKDVIRFTHSLDTVNHVASASETDTVDVAVDRLDSFFSRPPLIIKIDVEGYETEVIKGAERLLNDEGLKAIIIELNGSGKRYGYDEEAIHQQLLNHGFSPYQYWPFERRLEPLKKFGNHNTVYIRDFLFIQERIRAAGKIRILNKEF